MRETQQSISDWAVNTFGADGSDLVVASRANDEFAEFLRSFSKGKPDVVELADTAIVLVRLAARWHGKGDVVIALLLGGNLGDAIDEKMVINLRRTWKVIDGIGFHEHYQ
jgi:hypothetical protein